MVCKEELCKWFKNLRPYQRLDYMCGLLHMCLPLELRFLGSVLEDHGKKNYNFLRDAELKANNPADISKLHSGTDKQLRATVNVYLSLLHSSNTPCAQLLFEVLEKNLGQAFTFGTDSNENEEVLMALTLAINHPAFQFHQKNQLFEHFERNDPERNDRLNKQNDECVQIAENEELPNLYDEPPVIVHSPTGDTRLTTLPDFISHIELKDFSPRKQSGKKSEFKLHVTWSSGNVFEISKTIRDIQDLHTKLVRIFPEEKDLHQREWKFQCHTHNHARDELRRTLSNFLRLLLQMPAVLEQDIVTEFFKGGDSVQIQQGPPSPLSPVSVNTDEERAIPPFPLKSLTVCNSQPHAFPQNYLVPADPNLRLPKCNCTDFVPPSPRRICPLGVVSPQFETQSPPSSSNESPQNSRPTSPSPSTEVCRETIQLLKLLNLEQYSETLGRLTLRQLKMQSAEDFAKAGLPNEAQYTLRSKLENINREKSMNGLVDGNSSVGPTLSPASPNSLPWSHAPPNPMYLPPTMYPRTVLFAPTMLPDVADTSPPDSEVSSAPPSPTQIYSNPRLRTKMDSSGSDDNDKEKLNSSEIEKQYPDGRRKAFPHRTALLQPQPHPHLDEMKGSVMRQPLSLNMYPDTKPELFPVVGGQAVSTAYNGYQSDPNPSPGTSTNFPRSAFFSSHLVRHFKPAPAHTNVSLHNKNVINMPPEGHIKQPQVVMYYHGAVRTDLPMTPVNLNNNTTYNANNEGSSQRVVPPYSLNVMTRPNVPVPTPRSVLTNISSATTVTISQGGNQPLAPGMNPGAANIGVKPSPANGVPLQMPNPTGTPPESIHSGSDSPLQMIHGPSTASNTPLTSTSTFTGGTPYAVSTSNHSQCSSCGCNCNNSVTATSTAGYQHPYGTLPYHPYMHGYYQNGMIPQFSNIAAYGHHVPPPSYPNGLNHEMYINSHAAGFQHVHHPAAPQQMLPGGMYRSIQHNPGNNPEPPGKLKVQGCYNCGSSMHKAYDCKENSMDAMQGNYHLNYKPKSDSD